MKHQFKTKPKDTLGDLLPYNHFDEGNGILWLKDGSASSVLELIPRNSFAMTQEDLLSLRQSLSDVLNRLPESATIQLLLVREHTKETSELSFNRWTRPRAEGQKSDALDLLRKNKFEQLNKRWKENSLYQTKVFLTVRVSPGLSATYQHRLGPLSFLSYSRQSATNKPASAIADEIQALSSEIAQSLTAQGLTNKRASKEEIVTTIYRFLNPERSRYIPPPTSDSEVKSLSEVLALTDLIENRSGLDLGRTTLRIGSLKSYPESSIPALMTAFASECQSFFAVLTVLSLSQLKEKERLTRLQRLATGLAGGNSVRNIQAENQLRDLEDTLNSMISSGEKLFASSIQVVQQSDGDDDLTSKLKFNRLLECGERIGGGCQWFEETAGAYPVFFGILPFAPTFLARPRRLLSQNLSDFLPVYGIGSGHSEALTLFETPFQSLIGYSPFEKSPSGNILVFGETGSGKSTIVAGLLLNANAGDQINGPSGLVIDVGNSFKRSILFLGGTSIDFSPNSGSVLNPFDLEKGTSKPSPDKVKFLGSFLEEILGESGNLPKLEKALLETELLAFYETEKNHTLTNFRIRLSNSEHQELRKLSLLLSLWCHPKPFGLLFDGKTNVDLDAPHIQFELKGCQRYPDLLRAAMLVVMDVIQTKVKERFPKRCFTVIDEAHTIIRPSKDGRFNSASRWADDYFRQVRKLGSSAVAITQNPKDIKTEDISDGILANAPNRLILKQRGDEKALREDLKLNEKAMRDVFSLTQVRGEYSEFYLQSDSISGVMVYRPTPLELWLTTTHPPDVDLMNREQADNPSFDLIKLMEHLSKKYPHGAPSALKEFKQ